MNIIFGPSHCARLSYLFETYQLNRPMGLEVDGKGGRPSWDPSVIQKVLASTDENILFFVPDFRFGNATDLSAFDTDLDKLTDERFLQMLYSVRRVKTGVSKEKISQELDFLLYRISVRVLEILKRKVKKIKFIFWCLTIRERDNYSKGRYVKHGAYEHPIWNLKNLIDKFDSITLDTSMIVQKKIKFSHIDSSGHPSLIGHIAILYSFLKAVKFETALKNTYREYKLLMIELSNSLSSQKKVLFLGKNRLIDVYRNFSAKGIFPKFENIAFEKLEAIDLASASYEYDCIIFTDAVPDEINNECNYLYFPYSKIAQKLISLRDENGEEESYNNLEYIEFSTLDCCDEKDFLNTLEIKIIPAYFELNNTQFPTLKFITTLAQALSSNFANAEEKYEKLKLRLNKIYD